MTGTAYEELLARLDALAPGESIAIPRSVLDPRPVAWRRSIGLPKRGASLLTQWRHGVVHVHVTPTEYILHRDSVDPHLEPWRHLAEDVPRLARALRLGAGAIAAGLVAALALRARGRRTD